MAKIPIPLGKSAYDRQYSQSPEIQMVNRFFEQDPTNLIDGSALLSRFGTTVLAEVGDGPIRRLKTESGAFDSDLFVVSNETLYRLGSSLLQLEIEGTVGYLIRPSMAVTVGADFEHLFISDGQYLQIYEGPAKARATLTGDPAESLSEGDVVRVGDMWYEFTAGDVDDNTPDGSETNPWRVALGLAKASAVLRFTADSPIELNTAILLGEIPEGVPGDSLRTVYVGSRDNEIERNNPQGTGGNPYRLAFYRGMTRVAYLTLLKNAINATGVSGVDYSRSLVDPNPFVSGDEITGPSTGSDPTENSLTVRARQGGTVGNSIQCRNVLDLAPNLRWEDADGNPTLALTGGSDTSGDIPSALQNLERAINASGIAGVDYSTDLTANIAAEVESYSGNSLVVASRSAEYYSTVVSTDSAALSWSSMQLSGGGEHRLDLIAMPDGVPSGVLLSIGGFILVAVNGSDRFYWIRPGEREIDPLNFATAESLPDAIVDMLDLSDQVVMLGATGIEFWSSTGSVELPFRPSRSQTLNVGVVQNSAVKFKDRIMFVGTDGVAYATNGGPVERMSNNGIEEQIRRQFNSEGSDRGISSWGFDQDGHTFYVMDLDDDFVPVPTPEPPPQPNPEPEDSERVVIAGMVSAYSSPGIFAWRIFPDGTFGNLYNNLTDGPRNDIRDVAVSPNANVVLAAHFGSPYISAWRFNVDLGFGAKYDDPSTVGSFNYGQKCAWHPSGLAVAVCAVFATGVRLLVYRWSDETGFGEVYPNSVGTGSNQHQSVRFSEDGEFIVCACVSTNGYTRVYQFNLDTGITGVFTLSSGNGSRGVLQFYANMNYAESDRLVAVSNGPTPAQPPHVTAWPFNPLSGMGTRQFAPDTPQGTRGSYVQFLESGNKVIMLNQDVGAAEAVYLWDYSLTEGFSNTQTFTDERGLYSGDLSLDETFILAGMSGSEPNLVNMVYDQELETITFNYPSQEAGIVSNTNNGIGCAFLYLNTEPAPVDPPAEPTPTDPIPDPDPIPPGPGVTEIELTGSGTFTVPEGVFVLQRLLMAGGGGGGGSFRGGGGGGGAVDLYIDVPVTPGEGIPYSVGQGGAGGTDGNPGSNGGDTTFGQYLKKGGGGGGSYQSSQEIGLTGGPGGGSTGGQTGGQALGTNAFPGGAARGELAGGGGGGTRGPGGWSNFDEGGTAPAGGGSGGPGVDYSDWFEGTVGEGGKLGGGGGGGCWTNDGDPVFPLPGQGRDGGGSARLIALGVGEDGTDGSGGGGGGGSLNEPNTGGRGGHGTIVIRYVT